MIYQIFICSYQNVSDIENRIEERKLQLAAAKQTLQPTLVFVGNYSSIATCMVVFDCIRYYLTNVIDAVELALYTFFALDIQYPSDSEQLWLFLQQAVGGIKVPGDGRKNGMSIVKLLGQCV